MAGNPDANVRIWQTESSRTCSPAVLQLLATDSWLTVVGHIPHPLWRIIYAFPWSTYVVCMGSGSSVCESLGSYQVVSPFAHFSLRFPPVCSLHFPRFPCHSNGLRLLAAPNICCNYQCMALLAVNCTHLYVLLDPTLHLRWSGRH